MSKVPELRSVTTSITQLKFTFIDSDTLIEQQELFKTIVRNSPFLSSLTLYCSGRSTISIDLNEILSTDKEIKERAMKITKLNL